MDPTMVDHGMFHGATNGKNVPHEMDDDTTRHLRDPWSRPCCTMEHAIVYSIVPDDACVDNSSMGQSTKKLFL